MKEDRHKTTFVIEWGCFQYTVMLFGLKNAPAIFSRIVFIEFKYFIQKFLEVYMEYWTVYGLVKDHITNLRLMLERHRQHQISLNLRKCIFCALFGILLGHIVKRNVGWSLQDCNNCQSTSTNDSKRASGDVGPYKVLLKVHKVRYATITTSMEKLLKNDAKFE